MFAQIKKLVKAPILKPLISKVRGFLTKDTTPSAKAYAKNVVNEATDALPGLVETLATAAAAYAAPELTGIDLGMKLLNNADQIKEVALLPAKVMHHYKNYQFLNGIEDGHLLSREEDNFVVLTDPSLEVKKVASQFKKIEDQANDLYFSKGLNVKRHVLKPIMIEDYTQERRLAAPCA